MKENLGVRVNRGRSWSSSVMRSMLRSVREVGRREEESVTSAGTAGC